MLGDGLSKPSAPPGSRRTVWAIALLSLALNLTGLTWGLPARWHPDEKADLARDMALAGRLRPDSFINPSLPLYAMMPVAWLQARLAGGGLLPEKLADPLVAGRGLSALAGAGSVLVLGLALARRRDRLPWAPPLFLALAPGFVNLCHFATPEAWLFLGAAATLALALSHLEGRASAMTLGVVLGLTASTKYTAAALLAPVLAAVWLAPEKRPARPAALAALGACSLAVGALLAGGLDLALAGRLHLKDVRLLHPQRALAFVRSLEHAALAAGVLALVVAGLAWRQKAWARRLARPETAIVAGAALAGFVLGTPYAVLDPLAFLSDLAFNHQTRFEYKGLLGGSTSYGPYLRLLGHALTGPLLAAALLGALIAAGRTLRRDRRALVLLTALVAPYLLVASSGHQALRFLAPAFPAAAALAGLALQAVSARRVRLSVALLVGGRAALASGLLLRLFFVDSRILASRWLEQQVLAGETIDLIANNPGYAPRIPQGRSLRLVPTLSREMAPGERFAEAAARYPTEASPWLILTAAYYERFLDHPDQRPERAAFFRDLLEGRGGFVVAARFKQQGWLRPEAEFLDPEIVVLRRATGATETEQAPGAK